MQTRIIGLTFQSTLPQGERQDSIAHIDSLSKFQSTLPQGERLLPLRGFPQDRYFNPLSRRGRDPGIYPDCCQNFYFNPLSRRGRDNIRKLIYFNISISIHSPAGGETMCDVDRVRAVQFQSTLPQGERLRPVLDFNPLSRRGRDFCVTIKIKNKMHFNPLSRRGRDASTASRQKAFSISIHSPAGGETAKIHNITIYIYDFCT